ncbi:MAG TPA: MarR family transcriptional regulator [Lachnospiraceae bacterium]|nr:MarR family transcriptional regulator [Lachnospiraceae bacterium]
MEEKVLITGEFKDISKNDMHIIDAIGNSETKNMSTLAKKLKVTVGTLTIAINNLVKKGYVNRLRSKEDKRVVLVSLSEKGQRAYAKHSSFHENMVHTIVNGLGKTGTEVLIDTLRKVHVFINHYESEEKE